MSSEKEEALSAKIKELESQLLQYDPNYNNLEVDQVYQVEGFGHAKVVQFYEEDGLQKVQSLITPFAQDGMGVADELHDFLCSMPIELFKARVSDYNKNLGKLKKAKMIETLAGDALSDSEITQLIKELRG